MFVLQFFVVHVLVGLRKLFINNFVFPTWPCAAGFNNQVAAGFFPYWTPVD